MRALWRGPERARLSERMRFDVAAAQQPPARAIAPASGNAF